MKLIKKVPKLAKVKYSQGVTLSRNYQSWKCEAGVELDCKISEIPQTFERAKKVVEEKLVVAIEENKDVLGDLASVVSGKN